MFLVWWNTFDNIFISYYEGITKIGKKFNFDDGFLSYLIHVSQSSPSAAFFALSWYALRIKFLAYFSNALVKYI